MFLPFSHYTLMAFLLILSLILLSVLMMLLSTVNVISHLICRKTGVGLLPKSHLWNTVEEGRKWLVDFNAGKTQPVSFDQCNNYGPIDENMDWKPSFKILGLSSFSELDCLGLLHCLYLLNLPPRKLELWFVVSSSLLKSCLSP